MKRPECELPVEMLPPWFSAISVSFPGHGNAGNDSNALTP